MKRTLMSIILMCTLFTSILIPGNVYAKDIQDDSNASSSYASTDSPDMNKVLTKAQVLEDIDFVLAKIKDKHVSSVESIPEEVLKQKEEEISKLPENMTALEEWRTISRIIAKLHDAHTIMWNSDALDKRLPFNTYVDDNKFYCMDGDLKDYQVTAINGISIDQLYQTFKEHYSHEIDECCRGFFFDFRYNFIQERPIALAGIDTNNTLEVTFQKGYDIKVGKFDLVCIQPKDISYRPWISYKIDKENSVGIFTLDVCCNNDEFRQTVDKFFEEVAQNNIKNVIIDLRENLGGNSSVSMYVASYIKKVEIMDYTYFPALDVRNGNEIIHYESQKYTNEQIKPYMQPKNLFDGELFVTTSNISFSAATMFADFFQANHLAKIVGETPSNSLTAFTEIYNNFHRTPNSKIFFTVTSKKIYAVDPTKDQERLTPDIQVPQKDAIRTIYKIIKTNNHKEEKARQIILPSLFDTYYNPNAFLRASTLSVFSQATFRSSLPI